MMTRVMPLRLLVGIVALAGFATSACAASVGAGTDTGAEAPSSEAIATESSAQMTEDVAENRTGTEGWKQLDLPSLSIKEPFPYTIMVPPTWQHRRDVAAPGIWIGPPSAQPERDPAMVFVRHSPADLTNPTAVAANIRASAAAADEWSAPEVEVVDIEGVSAVLVLMERGEGEVAKSTFVLKVPLAEGSVDIMAVALTPHFDTIRDQIEKVFFSLRKAHDDHDDGAGTEGAESSAGR